MNPLSPKGIAALALVLGFLPAMFLILLPFIPAFNILRAFIFVMTPMGFIGGFVISLIAVSEVSSRKDKARLEYAVLSIFAATPVVLLLVIAVWKYWQLA